MDMCCSSPKWWEGNLPLPETSLEMRGSQQSLPETTGVASLRIQGSKNGSKLYFYLYNIKRRKSPFQLNSIALYNQTCDLTGRKQVHYQLHQHSLFHECNMVMYSTLHVHLHLQLLKMLNSKDNTASP